MEFVKLIYSLGSGYSYKGASNIEMNILGLFLSDDVACRKSSIRKWVMDDSIGMAASGNITRFEKEGNYVFLSELYSQEEIPTELKMTRQQLAQLMDEWYEKVCKFKPQEVIIKYENDQFSIETRN